MILCDMDEVLCDFVGGACKAWGVTKNQVYEHWRPGVWDVVPPLSHALGLDVPMTDEAFWSRINGCPKFWEGLEPTPWMEELLRFLWDWGRKSGQDLYVLTSPSLCPHSYCGKATWFRKHLSLPMDRFVPWSDKARLAKSDRILIDDREETVLKFVAYGGDGIVFPRHHNSLHAHKDDPLAYVKTLLQGA